MSFAMNIHNDNDYPVNHDSHDYSIIFNYKTILVYCEYIVLCRISTQDESPSLSYNRRLCEEWI